MAGIFEVKSTAGNTHLGGEDFDQRLIQHFMAEFQRKHGVDMAQKSVAAMRLERIHLTG